jgi:hypothetical protein
MGQSPDGGERRAEGVIQPQGLSTYMYGTHVLVDAQGHTLYALRGADAALLDRHVGERVRVLGTLVPGYPVDGGPVLLHVTRVEAVRP